MTSRLTAVLEAAPLPIRFLAGIAGAVYLVGVAVYGTRGIRIR